MIYVKGQQSDPKLLLEVILNSWTDALATEVYNKISNSSPKEQHQYLAVMVHLTTTNHLITTHSFAWTALSVSHDSASRQWKPLLWCFVCRKLIAKNTTFPIYKGNARPIAGKALQARHGVARQDGKGTFLWWCFDRKALVWASTSPKLLQTTIQMMCKTFWHS